MTILVLETVVDKSIKHANTIEYYNLGIIETESFALGPIYDCTVRSFLYGFGMPPLFYGFNTRRYFAVGEKEHRALMSLIYENYP